MDHTGGSMIVFALSLGIHGNFLSGYKALNASIQDQFSSPQDFLYHFPFSSLPNIVTMSRFFLRLARSKGILPC